jgi:hypothetical protein
LIRIIDKRNFSQWKKYFKEEFVNAGGINLKEISKPWKASYMKTCISQKS